MLVLHCCCCYLAATEHTELIGIAAKVIGPNSTLVIVARIEGAIVQSFYCAKIQVVADATTATDITMEATAAAIVVITQSLEIIILPTVTAVCTITMLPVNQQMVMLVLAVTSK